MRTLQLTFLLLAFTFSKVYAVHPPTPETLTGATVVMDGKEANNIIETTPNIVVFDVRTKLEFNEQHLPKALYLPYSEKSDKVVDFKMDMDSWDLTALPKDTGTPIFVYCNGFTCWKSYKAAKMAIEKGKFTKVYWFRGGKEAWVEAKLPFANK